MALLTALLVLLCSPYFFDWTMMERGCPRADVPEAITGVRLPQPAAVVSIDEHGVIRVSAGHEMSLPVCSRAEVRSFAEGVVAECPDLPFILKIDKHTRCGDVTSIVGILNAVGVKLVVFYTRFPRAHDQVKLL